MRTLEMLLLQLLLVHEDRPESQAPADYRQKHACSVQLRQNHTLALDQGPTAHQNEAPGKRGKEQPGGYHQDGVVGEEREGLEAVGVEEGMWLEFGVSG